jgi:high-affinity Fe2+/Pb2+ permease
MRLVARWGGAVAGSAAGFALAWWVCGKLIGLDEGISLGVAGAVLAVLLAVGAWWAPRGADGGGSDGSGGRRLVQRARAGRDAYLAGRDMTIEQRRKDE